MFIILFIFVFASNSMKWSWICERSASCWSFICFVSRKNEWKSMLIFMSNSSINNNEQELFYGSKWFHWLNYINQIYSKNKLSFLVCFKFINVMPQCTTKFSVWWKMNFDWKMAKKLLVINHYWFDNGIASNFLCIFNSVIKYWILNHWTIILPMDHHWGVEVCW